jgi:hypothetical protein
MATERSRRVVDLLVGLVILLFGITDIAAGSYVFGIASASAGAALVAFAVVGKSPAILTDFISERAWAMLTIVIGVVVVGGSSVLLVYVGLPVFAAIGIGGGALAILGGLKDLKKTGDRSR